MEQNHNTPASSAEQQDTSATKVYRNKKGKKATIREFFLHLHKEILDGEQTTFKLGSCSRGQDRRLVETVVGASKRAFDNIIVCKAAQAREEKPSSSNIHKGPIDVGINPVSELFRHAVAFFLKQIVHSQHFYPKSVRSCFKGPIAAAFNNSVDQYTAFMEKEFYCLTLPMRGAPPEGISYLNLRDQKRLWDLPYHRLFLVTMLQVCKEVGHLQMNRHDMNLFMYGNIEASKMFRFVHDPRLGDYNVDENLLYSVSCAVQRWGIVLWKIAAGYDGLKEWRIPVPPSEKGDSKNRKALNREHELLKDVIRAMEERGNLGGLGPTTWTVRHERLG